MADDGASEAEKCDYLVVGAGASGMAFVDSLLLHRSEPASVLLLDKRTGPGGHWHDAYDFVRLHQPARNYGVESLRLEERTKHPELRASRAEVLEYYNEVLDSWRAKGHDVRFVGGATYDFAAGAYTTGDTASPTAVAAATAVVDARYTENDLPLHVPPRFACPAGLDLIPPNALPARDAASAARRRYVVVGAGKTGQDTMLYLRETLRVPTEQLLWLMPTDPWITARDPPEGTRQLTCMEYIATALAAHADAGAPAGAAGSADFLARGFARAEAEGRIYRIDPAVTPTKFMDATLSKREVGVLAECAPCIVRGHGRVASIADAASGHALTCADGSAVALPWAADAEAVAQTTFVHCSAGAFNFGASASEPRKLVFGSSAAPRQIRVQELFQFPGFCFNGGVIGYLEAREDLSLDEKNRLREEGEELASANHAGLVAAGVLPAED